MECRYDKKEEIRLKRMLEEKRSKEEEYWRQRSRIQWLKAGDRNTKFFHQTIIEKRRKNNISQLQKSNGVWIKREEDIKKEYENISKEKSSKLRGVRMYKNSFSVYQS